MRFRGMPSVLAALLLVAATAHAGAIVRTTDPLAPERLASPAPPRANATEAELVAWARALPAAQIALDQLAGAGYVRAPEADLARSNGGRSCVSLAFTDPAHPGRAPLALVMSDPIASPPREYALAAVFDVDTNTGQVQLAPGIPDGVECIVTVVDPGGTRPVSVTVNKRSARDALVRWLGCSVLACTASGAGCTVVGTLLGPLGPPAIAGCAIAVCATLSFFCIE